MRFGSLFTGIGGLDLGLERAGMECAWQVEIDDYCRRVLTKHWPNVPKFRDVRECGEANLAPVDLICGGFPCQDVSYAGLAAGLEGERSGLWFEMFRIICELRPSFVLVENVAALLDRGAGRVLADFASIGFHAEWETLRASSLGAPHRRGRVFIVAHSDEINWEARMGNFQNWQGQIFRTGNQERFPIWLQAASQFVGMDDGLSAGVYKDRVGALGNAVVPQCAEFIGKMILQSIQHERR